MDAGVHIFTATALGRGWVASPTLDRLLIIIIITINNNLVEFFKILQLSSLTLAEMCNIKVRLCQLQFSTFLRLLRIVIWNTRELYPDVPNKCDWLCGCNTRNCTFLFRSLGDAANVAWTEEVIFYLKRSMKI